MGVEAGLLFVLAAVAVVVVVHVVGERSGLPAAALLTLLGAGYGLLPGPNVTLDPVLVLTLVLPPLLYSAALDSSLLAIRRNLRTVVSLSVLLVLVTAIAVGIGFWVVVPGASLAAAIALGAAVAPPDPVAALAVGRQVGLPPKLTVLIQGEGLLNDATALTTLTVAIEAARGGSFSAPSALGEFLLAAVGGVAAGWLVAMAVRRLGRLRRDPLVANAVSLACPFVAYLLGEAAHVSGVLAVVVAGLINGHDMPRSTSGASRLQLTAVWRLVSFLLEGLVFLLIGQQLPAVLAGLGRYDTGTILAAAGVTVGAVLLVRPLWLLLTQALPRSLHARLGGADADDTDDADDDVVGAPEVGGAHRFGALHAADQRLSGREILVLSWAGTRGVISLAAIATVPLLTNDGDPFPNRDLLLFCTFVAVLVTLVGQGLTFAPLVRALGLRADRADQARLRNEARSAAVRAGLARLSEIRDEDHDDVEDRVIETLDAALHHRLDRYRTRLDLLSDAEPGEIPHSPQYEAALRVRRAVLDAQREELVRWRDAGRLPDEGLRALERELDHEEGLLPGRPLH